VKIRKPDKGGGARATEGGDLSCGLHTFLPIFAPLFYVLWPQKGQIRYCKQPPEHTLIASFAQPNIQKLNLSKI
jgi:hypothetical protein